MDQDEETFLGMSQSPSHRRQSPRYPYSVVWTPLPIVSIVFPFIGHTGICTSEGIIHDFAGSYVINKDQMAFSHPVRQWRLNADEMDARSWDEGIRRADDHFCKMMHNLCCNNCHHHVATSLNEMNFNNISNRSQANVWYNMLVNGRWISWSAMFKTLIPPFILWGGILTFILETYQKTFAKMIFERIKAKYFQWRPSGRNPNVAQQLQPVVWRFPRYILTFIGSIIGWYGLSRHMKTKIPEEEHYYKKRFMTNCTIDATPIEKCKFPSLSILVNLGKLYGFRLSQAAWAASHLCPIEWHVQLVEYIIDQVEQPLQQIITERFSELKNIRSKHEEKNENVNQQLENPPLAQLVGAIIELKIDDMLKYFESVEILKQVHFEEHLKQSCDVLENDTKLKILSVEEKVKIIQETIRSVMYEFLVANWEASRYFDAFTYKEGYFGPRKTGLAEGFNTGTRGASYLCLDKPELRFDIYPEKKAETIERRENARIFELETDRGYLENRSRRSLQKQKGETFMGTYPVNLKEEFDKLKKKKGKEFLRSPYDSMRYKAGLKYLPNEEDPYEMFLSPDEFGVNGISMDDLIKATTMIRKYGVIRIRNAIPREAILHVKRKLFVSPQYGRDMGDKIVDIDGNVDVQRCSFGRITAFLRGSSFEPFLVEIQRLWMPLIYAIFPTEQYYGGNAVEQFRYEAKNQLFDWKKNFEAEDDDDEESPKSQCRVDELPTRRLFCSAVQLTCQDKNAPCEGFTVDNAAQSFTVLIALDEMRSGKDPSGAIQLIPGSHHIGVLKDGMKPRRLWQRNWKEFFKGPNYYGYFLMIYLGPVNTYLKPGDVLIWDSRLFHRCHGTGGVSTSSYMLFRYDFPETPPPCQATPQLFMNKIKSVIIYWAGLITRVAYAR